MTSKKVAQFYDEFHEKIFVSTRVMDEDNFTYRNVLYFLNKFISPPIQILDIGCGVGPISLYLASKGNSVLGIDVSAKAIRVAQCSAKQIGLQNVFFQAGDFTKVKINKKFDFIICSEVLEHLPNDEIALQKMYSLLKPQGILILSVPSKNAPFHRLKVFFFGRDSFDTRVGHLRRYTLTELRRLIEKVGFRVVDEKETEGILRNFLFVSKIGNYFLVFVRSFVKQFVTLVDNMLIPLFGASQLVIIAQK